LGPRVDSSLRTKSRRFAASSCIRRGIVVAANAHPRGCDTESRAVKKRASFPPPFLMVRKKETERGRDGTCGRGSPAAPVTAGRRLRGAPRRSADSPALFMSPVARRRDVGAGRGGKSRRRRCGSSDPPRKEGGVPAMSCAGRTSRSRGARIERVRRLTSLGAVRSVPFAATRRVAVPGPGTAPSMAPRASKRSAGCRRLLRPVDVSRETGHGAR